MMLFSRTLPFLSIFLLVLIAVMPWGLPPGYRIALPLLPIIAIHYWTLRHDAMIPEWMVFLAGLSLDLLTHGPLGYWSLIYLFAYLTALLGQPTASRGPAARLAALLAALALSAGAAWLVASAFALEWIEVAPFVRGSVFAALATIVILPMLRALDRPRDLGYADRFARGRQV